MASRRTQERVKGIGPCKPVVWVACYLLLPLLLGPGVLGLHLLSDDSLGHGAGESHSWPGGVGCPRLSHGFAVHGSGGQQLLVLVIRGNLDNFLLAPWSSARGKIRLLLSLMSGRSTHLRSPTLIPEMITLRSWDISFSVLWLTPPMPELPLVRSSLCRLAVRLPPTLTGLELRGDLPGGLLGDLSLQMRVLGFM